MQIINKIPYVGKGQPVTPILTWNMQINLSVKRTVCQVCQRGKKRVNGL